MLCTRPAGDTGLFTLQRAITGRGYQSTSLYPMVEIFALLTSVEQGNVTAKLKSLRCMRFRDNISLAKKWAELVAPWDMTYLVSNIQTIGSCI